MLKYLILVPILSLIRILRPFICIRFCELQSTRVGEFAFRVEDYLCLRDAGLLPKRTFDIFFRRKNVSNHQLAKMWDRALPLVIVLNKFWDALVQENKKFPGSDNHILVLENHTGKDFRYCDFSTHLRFTQEEEEFGRIELAKRGIDVDHDKIVPVHARDQAYLNDVYKKNQGSDDYNRCRNSSIESFIPAMKYLADQDCRVLRFGKITELKLPNDLPANIVDYANPWRSDFLDLYLSAKCHFFWGSASGPDAFPTVFRKPVIRVNYFPFARFADINGKSMKEMILPKLIYNKKQQRFLTFLEMTSPPVRDYMHPKVFASAGLQVIDNTSDEILDAVKEMDERVKGIWTPNREDQELQQRFREQLYSRFINPVDDPGKLLPIPASFLRKYKHLLEA